MPANSGDRQAVINLVSSYGPLLDAYRLADFRALYSAHPQLEFHLGDKLLLSGLDNYLALLEKRQAAFKQSKVQRRHYLTPRITSESNTLISGDAYVLLMSNNGVEPRMVSTGLYEFSAIKEGGIWKLSRWIAHLDSPLD